MPRSRKAASAAGSTMEAMSAFSNGITLDSSWEVRKPSKKCRNGTRVVSVALCATRARSCASCTELEESMAHPVARTAMTSEWSPKMERAWAAMLRAATWITVGSSSPAILNMLGIISSRPWEAVKVVASAPFCRDSVQCPGGARLGLHLDDLGHLTPDVGFAGGRPVVRVLAHRRGRGDGIEGDDLGERVRNARRRLIAIDADTARISQCRMSPPTNRAPRIVPEHATQAASIEHVERPYR